MGKFLWISPSRAAAFDRCPKSVKAPFIPSEAADTGTLVHSMVEMHQQGKSTKKVSMPKLANADKAADLFKNYLDMPEAQPDPVNTLSIESSTGNQMMPWGGLDAVELGHFGIRGKLDRLMADVAKGELIVDDWKTGSQKFGDDLDQWQPKFYFLLAYYRYAKHLETFSTFKFRWFWLKTGEITTWVYTIDDLEAIQADVMTLCEGYYAADKMDIWEEQINGLCGWCGFKTKCATYNNLPAIVDDQISAKMPAEIVPDTFKTYYDALLEAKTIQTAFNDRIKTVNKMLMDCLKANDGEVPGFILAEKGTSSVKYDSVKLFETACRYKVADPIEFFKAEKGKLEKAFKEKGIKGKALKEIFEDAKESQGTTKYIKAVK